MPLLRGPCRFSVAWLLLHARPSRASPLPHGEKAQSSLHKKNQPVGRIMIANSILFEVPEVFQMFCLITFSFSLTRHFQYSRFQNLYCNASQTNTREREKIRSVKGSANKTSPNWLQQLSLLEGHLSFSWICLYRLKLKLFVYHLESTKTNTMNKWSIFNR